LAENDATADHVQQAAPDERRILRRRVHYISGFDPRGAAHYFRLYRDEAAKQQSLLGAALQVAPRRRLDSLQSSWTVEATWGDTRVETDYRFMAWDDIVRHHWIRNPLHLVWRGLTGYPVYLATGGLRRAREISRGAFYSGILPLVYLLLVVVLMALAALAGYTLGAASGIAALAPLLTVAAAIGVGLSGLRLAHLLGILWLLRICLFIYDWGRQGIPDLTKRAREIAQAIVAAQHDDPADEVLIVGHSIGSMLAVSVAAALLEGGGKVPAVLAGRVGLMTLGQCIPWLAFMPEARDFHAELQRLAYAESLPWVDVSGPTDPLGFFNVDPVVEAGIHDAPPDRPRLVTARFFRMFHIETYRKLRRDKLRLHFQYLMASEIPADYDYFRITAGPGPALAPFLAETAA
jgi:pimeloyl-ACP methyl ester carboxylesterase